MGGGNSVLNGKLNLVDLAGSERVRKTGGLGDVSQSAMNSLYITPSHALSLPSGCFLFLARRSIWNSTAGG